MDNLKTVTDLLDRYSGNFTLSSSVRKVYRPVVTTEADVVSEEIDKVSYLAVLSLDNQPQGLGIVASGVGDDSEDAINRMIEEVDDIYGN